MQNSSLDTIHFKKSPILTAILFIILAGLVSYFPALKTDIIGDDTMRIRDVYSSYQDSLGQAIQDTMPDRPVLIASVWLDSYLFGYNVAAFKAFNIFYHLFAALAALFFFYELSRALKNKNLFYYATAALILWVAHPMNNQVVMSIIQRGVSISSGFFLISLAFWVRSVSQNHQYRSNLLLVSLFLLIAIATKPNTTMAPLIQIFVAYWIAGTFRRRDLIRTIPTFMIVLLPIIPYTLIGVDPQNSPLSSLQYFWVQTEVIFKYFKNYLFPFELSFYKPETFIIPPVLNLTRFIYFTLHLMIITTAIYFFKKKKNVLSAWILITYLCFLPESSFFPIKQSYFDHRNYLPLLFTLVSFSYLFEYRKSISKMTKALTTLLFLFYFTFFNHRFINQTSTLHRFFISNIQQVPILFGIYVRYPLTEGKYSEAREIIEISKKRLAELNELTPAIEKEINRYKDFFEFENLDNSKKRDLIKIKIQEIDQIDFSINYYILLQKIIENEFSSSDLFFEKSQTLRNLHLKVAPIILNSYISTSLKSYFKRDLLTHLKNQGFDQHNYSILSSICKTDDCTSTVRSILILNIFFKVPFEQVEIEQLFKTEPRIKEEMTRAAEWMATFKTEGALFN